MKEYGLYDVKENEQCVYLGNISEIANYLNCNENSLRSYLTRKKKGKQDLLQRKYELIEILEEDNEINEVLKRKSGREIFKGPLAWCENWKKRKIGEAEWKNT